MDASPAEAILHFLSEHKNDRIALVAHQRPDGDALGSCLGLAHVLRSQGFDASVVNLAPIPLNLHFLASDVLVRYDTPDWHREYGALGILDCGELGRVDGINQPAAAALPTFNIDHHVSSSGIGVARWIAPDASSVGEMVVTLCRLAGWPLTAPAAQALWTAIVTDTGRFSFENTTAPCLEAAMECVIAGARPEEVATHIYQSVSPEERRLQAVVLSRMEMHEGGRMAIAWLRRSDFLDAGTGIEGAQDLINLLRDTAGVEVAILLYEIPGEAPGAASGVKVSLRTISPHNALAIAAKFNGGGHKRAAGCSLAGAMEEVKNRVLVTAKRAFFSYAGETSQVKPDERITGDAAK